MHSPDWLCVQDPVLATHTGQNDVTLLPIVVGLAITHKHSMTHNVDHAVSVDDGKASYTSDLSGCE